MPTSTCTRPPARLGCQGQRRSGLPDQAIAALWSLRHSGTPRFSDAQLAAIERQMLAITVGWPIPRATLPEARLALTTLNIVWLEMLETDAARAWDIIARIAARRGSLEVSDALGAQQLLEALLTGNASTPVSAQLVNWLQWWPNILRRYYPGIDCSDCQLKDLPLPRLPIDLPFPCRCNQNGPCLGFSPRGQPLYITLPPEWSVDNVPRNCTNMQELIRAYEAARLRQGVGDQQESIPNPRFAPSGPRHRHNEGRVSTGSPPAWLGRTPRTFVTWDGFEDVSLAELNSGFVTVLDLLPGKAEWVWSVLWIPLTTMDEFMARLRSANEDKAWFGICWDSRSPNYCATLIPPQGALQPSLRWRLDGTIERRWPVWQLAEVLRGIWQGLPPAVVPPTSHWHASLFRVRIIDRHRRPTPIAGVIDGEEWLHFAETGRIQDLYRTLATFIPALVHQSTTHTRTSLTSRNPWYTAVAA